MPKLSYSDLAVKALEKILHDRQKFTQYTQWHRDGIVRVSLATQLSVEDLGTPAAELAQMRLTNFKTAQAVARVIVDKAPDGSQGEPVELQVAFQIIDEVCNDGSSWIDELELYKQALINAIDNRGSYQSIPCAQNSVVSAMRALWALVLAVHGAEIHPCGAMPYVIP
jgi:hypothetical protein